MAAGPAIEKRWKVERQRNSDGPSCMGYGGFLHRTSCSSSYSYAVPEENHSLRRCLAQKQLFPLIRSEVQNNLNGYVSANAVLDSIDDYIVPPGLGDYAGLCGALALGLQAMENRAS